MPQKSVQKKQGFETLPSKKENPGAVQGGLGRRPILKNDEVYFSSYDRLSGQKKAEKDVNAR